MILINLLPYREQRRKQRKEAFFAGLGAAALVGGLLVGAGYLLLDLFINNQQSRNSYLQGEIDRLDAQIKDIASLREEIDSLTRRQNAVEALQGERNLPVHLLNELARLVPEGVYFTSVKQTDKEVQLTGLAQTQERISELLRNTAYSSEWLVKPELVESKAAAQGQNKEQRQLFEFAMRLGVKRPQEAASAPAGAASVPAAAASLPAAAAPKKA